MVEHNRRDVLKYTGLTTMGGLLSTGVAAAAGARTAPLEWLRRRSGSADDAAE
ncbi:hypothetical protein [Natronorubrum sp. DTA7]|uniref:hypothetical protein n=1 Tax=Natronorubrum sp. DTA7 TaxID=3447016 RepID=UPI003F87374B